MLARGSHRFPRPGKESEGTFREWRYENRLRATPPTNRSTTAVGIARAGPAAATSKRERVGGGVALPVLKMTSQNEPESNMKLFNYAILASVAAYRYASYFNMIVANI
jgi:hypothetical protein